MLAAIEYIKKQDEVMIFRCFGDGAYLELPAYIDELPVTELADHIFAREPSWRLRGEPRFLAVMDPDDGTWKTLRRTDQEEHPADYPEADPMCSDMLREIALPATMKKIGNYAFYGCRELYKLTIPVSLAELGSGAFVACNHLKQVCFFMTDPKPLFGSIKTVIGEISYEIEIILTDETGHERMHLIYPEYYEESIENVPARIIIMKYEGAGYKYRQYFKDGYPDLEKYDSLFSETRFVEYPETVMRLAAMRLLYPVRLGENAAGELLEWMGENRERTAAYCLRERRESDGIALIEALNKRGFFDDTMLAFFLEQAGKAKNAEAVSLLMQYRKSRIRTISYTDRFSL